jgi:hypothetical protein
MIVEVWQRVMDLAKTGTSGMDTAAEWNGKANSAQKILQEALTDVAEINQKASDALSWLKIQSDPITSDATGKITLPGDYLHLDSVALVVGSNRYPTHKIRTNEIENTRISPIRKSDLTNNEINVYQKTGALYVMPEQEGIAVSLLYYKKVPDAAITLTQVSSDDSDLVTPSIGTDFGWPVSVFNLLVYLILEQLGIELKEQLLLEYSQFGVSRDMIKTNA